MINHQLDRGKGVVPMDGVTNRSFISAHFLLSTYFLTAQSYKCMRLIIWVYGMYPYYSCLNTFWYILPSILTLVTFNCFCSCYRYFFCNFLVTESDGPAHFIALMHYLLDCADPFMRWKGWNFILSPSLVPRPHPQGGKGSGIHQAVSRACRMLHVMWLAWQRINGSHTLAVDCYSEVSHYNHM